MRGRCLEDACAWAVTYDRRSMWACEVEGPSEIKCPLCSSEFQALALLQLHIRSHLPVPAYIYLQQVEGLKKLSKEEAEKAYKELTKKREEDEATLVAMWPWWDSPRDEDLH